MSDMVKPPVKKPQLLLPQKSVVPKPATVTPQTMEKGIIDMSKAELKNAKIGTQQPLPKDTNIKKPLKSEVPRLLKKKLESKIEKTNTLSDKANEYLKSL
jgi:hypothetical protein